MKVKITKEHSQKIEALISQKVFTVQDIISLLDNIYTDNQIRYHINKYYPQYKNNLVKEYSKGGTKLEYLLKQIFPSNKIEAEFPLGERLRVDFVVTEPYNLAFEFDGNQHSEFSPFLHGDRSGFAASQERDSRKEFLLKNRGINLIRIDTLDISLQNIQELIDSTGYGNGLILDESLLTSKEKLKRRNQLQKIRLKELKQSATLQYKPQALKPIERLENLAYKNSIKEKQKAFRKEQYQKQKEWLKQKKSQK